MPAEVFFFILVTVLESRDVLYCTEILFGSVYGPHPAPP